MDYLKPYASLIEEKLQHLNLPEAPKSLYDPQRYFLNNGGKRIRPVLTLIGCGMCGGDYKRALPAAIAVELMHNFTLIHDDIMDQAESRRGAKAIHQKWSEATAILAGDGMLVQAMLQLQELPGDVDHKKISAVFLDGINRVCEGQAMDMEFESRFDVTSHDYLEMIEGKTAALIRTSLQMGGMVAGAGEQDLLRLGVIGESLGIAFQIQDDWLDVVADPDKFGKRRGGDIVEGKKTFLMLTTLERSTGLEQKWLKTYLGNRPLDQEHVDKIIELYQKYDVTGEAQNVITSYYKKAEKALQQFGDSNYKRDLQQLIIYLQHREI